MTKYNDEIVKELIKYIESGNYIETACDAVGIAKSTFYEWVKEKADFSNAVKKAESQAIARNLTIIQIAAKKSWQAAAWFLERKDYERWGRKELVGGINDKPININLIPVKTSEDVEKLKDNG